jgi:hypothetical protein
MHASPTPYGWLNPEEVIRHALAAFYISCRFADAAENALPGENFTPETWLNEFTEVFSLRMGTAAEKAGISGFEYAAEMLENYTGPNEPASR